MLHAAELKGGNQHEVELAERVGNARVLLHEAMARAWRSKIASRFRVTFAASVSRWNIRKVRPFRSAVSTLKSPTTKENR